MDNDVRCGGRKQRVQTIADRPSARFRRDVPEPARRLEAFGATGDGIDSSARQRKVLRPRELRAHTGNPTERQSLGVV